MTQPASPQPIPSPGAHTDNPALGFIDAALALKAASGPDGMTLAEMVDRLDQRAFGVLILLLTLPCLVPGLPGAQLIAVAIFLLALQLAAGKREVWLPAAMLKARVWKGWIDAVADFADKRLRWTERLSRARLGWVTAGLGERLAGLVIALASITIMLPITNTIPSLAITLAAVGLLQRDGAFTLAGLALALAWIGALVTLIAGLVAGAGFAAQIAAERAPWLVDLLGR
jgi:hypothetical protein